MHLISSKLLMRYARSTFMLKRKNTFSILLFQEKKLPGKVRKEEPPK